MPIHEQRRFKSEFFKALSNPLRIAILDALRAGERGVGEIAAELAVEQAAASQQLAVLRSKNLVRFRKQGTFAIYSVTDPTIFAILDDVARLFQNQLVDLQSLLLQETAE